MLPSPADLIDRDVEELLDSRGPARRRNALDGQLAVSQSMRGILVIMVLSACAAGHATRQSQSRVNSDPRAGDRPAPHARDTRCVGGGDGSQTATSRD